MKNRLLLLLLSAMSLIVSAQEQMVRGRIVSQTNPVGGVLVVNINKEKEVRTDKQGFFSINALAGDTIFITGALVSSLEFTVTADDFKNIRLIEVTITSNYELEEIVIEKDNRITSEGLGLVPKGQKRYTPQERKLYTAGDFKAYHLLGLLGGSFPLDPVMNAINGRTKMLKKTVAIEKKELVIEALNRMFSDDEIVKDYNIPQEYVQGFYYYCVDDTEFSACFRAGNETHAKFLMNRLAIKYITLIKENDNKD